MNFRKIEKTDDPIIAKIIRDNLEKYHLDIPGTVYFDSFLDHLSGFYLDESNKGEYYTALSEGGEIVGGLGFSELKEIEACVEIQKVYLIDSVKGKGFGKEMMGFIEDRIKEKGYKKMYLETHTNLFEAIGLYKKIGFREIERPDFVNHSTMNVFMVKDL